MSIGDQKFETTAAEGKFRVKLKALKAGGPHKLTIQGTNTITLEDVLVGEVWICSGQSNMQWAVRQSNNADAEMAAAKLSGIRLFYVPRKTSPVPVEDVEAKWVVCSPENVGEFFMIRSALQSRDYAGHPPSAPERVPPVFAVSPVLPGFRPARGDAM